VSHASDMAREWLLRSRQGTSKLLRELARENDAILICPTREDVALAKEEGVTVAVSVDERTEWWIGRKGPVLIDLAAVRILFSELDAINDTMAARVRDAEARAVRAEQRTAQAEDRIAYLTRWSKMTAGAMDQAVYELTVLRGGAR
jgi:hypothetical protein